MAELTLFEEGGNENLPSASASIMKRSEEHGFSFVNTDSADHDRIPGDSYHNDTATPLPVVSVSPFPHWNMNETSQYYSREPAGGNSMVNSSQYKSYQNFQMGHNYLHEGEHNSHPCRSDSRVPCPEGYTGWPHQYTRPHNLTIPDDVMSAAFNLNNFGKPDSSGKCVVPSYGLASRPQMINPVGMPMSGNIGHPPLDMNFGMALYNANQGGVEPSLAVGKLDERFMKSGSGSNRGSKSSAVIPKIDVTGNSERVFLPPINTYQDRLGSRSSLNPGLQMNGAFNGFQNDSEITSNSAHAGNHEPLFDSRPGLHLGPSYAFQRPAAGDQNWYLRQVHRDLGLGDVKDIGMEFVDVGRKNGPERCMVLPPLPVVGSQTMPCESGPGRANGRLVPPSIGMLTDKLPTELLPKNNKFVSQSFVSPPLVVATRSTRLQDPSSNHGQPPVIGSVQQSNPPLRPYSTSDLGIQTGKGNMTMQVSRPSIVSPLKRAASQPLSSTVQNHRRKTIPTQFIHPSNQTWTKSTPSVPNTPRAISPTVHAAQSLTPQAPHSFVPTLFPTTWTKPVLPPPNPGQAIPPFMPTVPYHQPNDKRIPSFHPSFHTPPPSNQQLITQSLARQHSRAPNLSSVPSFASNHIKFKDQRQTPEPIGYKCFLCKRDLSYAPEGPISQPPVPPAAAILSCGHTFHNYCLDRITPDDQSKDPPCIPCALRE